MHPLNLLSSKFPIEGEPPSPSAPYGDFEVFVVINCHIFKAEQLIERRQLNVRYGAHEADCLCSSSEYGWNLG